MSNMTQEWYFGNDTIPVLTAQNGELIADTVYVPSIQAITGNVIPSAIKDELGQKVEDVYSSIERCTATEEGHEYGFEIAHVEGTDPDRGELRRATFKSSATENFGNGFEVARMAYEDPRTSITYVASDGFGISSPLTWREQRYLRKHGTLLHYDDGEVKPLPAVRALGKVLDDMGVPIDRIASDSFGRVMTTDWAAVYGNGNIKAVHQNVPTNVFDRGRFRLVKGMMVDDPKISEIASGESPDALRMSKDILAFVEGHVGDDFRKKQFRTHNSVRMMYANLVGSGRGPEAGDPLMKSMATLLRNNPEANVLFTIGELDPLVRGDDLTGRLGYIARELSSLNADRDTRNTITAVTVEGSSHGIQTHYPQFLAAVKLAILG